jgi:hypothetical protein
MPPFPPLPPLDAGHAVLAAALLLAVILLRRARGRIRRGNLRRGARAARAEGDAELLLHRAGYRVVDRQLSGTWTLRVDGEDREVSVRADLIVRRRRRLYVAEVKTGRSAPRPDLPETRRQLLEYLLAFDVAGVLLVDMEAGSVHAVEFPGLLAARGRW